MNDILEGIFKVILVAVIVLVLILLLTAIVNDYTANPLKNSKELKSNSTLEDIGKTIEKIVPGFLGISLVIITILGGIYYWINSGSDGD